MKKFILTFLILSATALSAWAQTSQPSNNASVEPSIFSVEAGLLGIWAGYEFRLSDRLTIKAEAGIDSRLYQTNFEAIRNLGKDNYAINYRPVFSIEPRFYLIKSRAKNGRNIKINSGTYMGLQTSFYPTAFSTSQEAGAQDQTEFSQLSYIPTIGMRRTIGGKFFIDGGLGVGFMFNSFKDSAAGNEFLPALNIRMRIGYRF